MSFKMTCPHCRKTLNVTEKAFGIRQFPQRNLQGSDFALVKKTDLLLTTYSLAHRDRALLTDITWEYLALDEIAHCRWALQRFDQAEAAHLHAAGFKLC